MARVKRSLASRKRRKKIISLASGYRGRSKNCYRLAKQAVARAGQFAYIDRRAKKRSFKSLWIVRINAAARELGMKYSEFINKLKKSGILLNRKMIADIAYKNPSEFENLIKKI